MEGKGLGSGRYSQSGRYRGLRKLDSCDPVNAEIVWALAWNAAPVGPSQETTFFDAVMA